MLLDHCYGFSLLLWSYNLKKKFFEDPLPLCNLFGPVLDPPRAPGQNALKHVRDLEYFIYTKFHQSLSNSSIAKADYVFPYIYMHIHKCIPFFHLEKKP